jgi:hypothetical protein
VIECEDENAQFGCRNSDAALALYNSQAEPDFGRIARPGSRGTGELALDSSNPRFTITQATFGWSIDGEIIEKVGRTTGWSGGEVVDGCTSVTPLHPQTFLPTSPTIWCTKIVEALGGRGDSGAPTFKLLNGTSVELRGMYWGQLGMAGQGCSNNHEGVLVCPFFLASNLGGIEWDLDPYQIAPLSYYFWPGGGEDPGDPGPDPCDPECPW